jgi:hypothetical protein
LTIVVWKSARPTLRFGHAAHGGDASGPGLTVAFCADTPEDCDSRTATSTRIRTHIYEPAFLAA